MPAVAADIAVPSPFKTPVILVVIVIAGVELAVATVPVNPFALVTLTVVTVPAPAPPVVASASLIHCEPLYFNTCPVLGVVIVTPDSVPKLGNPG